jgi:predicted nucleic acid-binding protein
MKNSAICVDANVVVALLTEEDSPVHLRWRQWIDEQRAIFCPAILAFEITNALHQQWRHNLLSGATVAQLLSVLGDLPIQVQTHPELHTRAAQLAQQLKLGAAYDAHYVALAQLMGAELWTLDARLHRRFAEITPVVHLLA